MLEAGERRARFVELALELRLAIDEAHRGRALGGELARGLLELRLRARPAPCPPSRSAPSRRRASLSPSSFWICSSFAVSSACSRRFGGTLRASRRSVAPCSDRAPRLGCLRCAPSSSRVTARAFESASAADAAPRRRPSPSPSPSCRRRARVARLPRRARALRRSSFRRPRSASSLLRSPCFAAAISASAAASVREPRFELLDLALVRRSSFSSRSLPSVSRFARASASSDFRRADLLFGAVDGGLAVSPSVGLGELALELGEPSACAASYCCVIVGELGRELRRALPRPPAPALHLHRAAPRAARPFRSAASSAASFVFSASSSSSLACSSTARVSAFAACMFACCRLRSAPCARICAARDPSRPSRRAR